MYKGKILAGIAAFKAHATFGFWDGSQVLETGAEQESAMGQFGRLTSLDDLPPRAELIDAREEGDEADRRRREAGPQQACEGALHRAAGPARGDRRRRPRPPRPGRLSRRRCQREYVEWVTEAKRDETRAKRLAQTIEWLAEGKRRNWKYENC